MGRLLLTLLLLLGNAATTSAAIVLLKDRSEPIIGTLLREETDRVAIRTVDADGKPHEQTLQRSEIDEIIPAHSSERLAALDPGKPTMTSSDLTSVATRNWSSFDSRVCPWSVIPKQRATNSGACGGSSA